MARLQPQEKQRGVPEEWKTIYYKTYPRLPKINLDDPEPPTANLFQIIKKRRSRRKFSNMPITKGELSLLLKYSCGITDAAGKKRAQPSGGGRFPIEVYPLIFHSGENLQTGLYHYNVREHQLDVLWEREFSEDDILQMSATSVGLEFLRDASVIMVMTAVFWRNQNKYREPGYRMILQESGHIGQNIYLIAEALGLKCFAFSGTWDENLEKLIDIDGVTESVVYALAIGK